MLHVGCSFFLHCMQHFFIFHTIGPNDLLYLSPAPYLNAFKLFLIYFPKCPFFNIIKVML